MTSETTISQQIPTYFLQEASELLQQMEHDLQTLHQDFGVKKMHSLMRTAHTLKGAAASVGLEAIKTTTHSLEDAFKALCVPEATLTDTVEGLIFEAYDCLQLLVSAQTSAASIEESGILDRMANVVSKLQQNLGDQFGQDGYLPTSTELGFDMTQSIFEMGVAQRLKDLETALEAPDTDVLSDLLRGQADVFFGLAESLNLPGFGEIAHATITALENQPNQVLQIATIALADYRSGQKKILQGDRNQGGEPSTMLKAFGQPINSSGKQPPGNSQKLAQKSNWLSQWWQGLSSQIKLFSLRNKNGFQASFQPETDPPPAIGHDESQPIGSFDARSQESALSQEGVLENTAVIALPKPLTEAADQASLLSTDLLASQTTAVEKAPSSEVLAMELTMESST
ncbi:MAG: Hpt domain-containing protein, partial [Leptolyngbyaceae cyanobacterium MAG.088]|nr:Hpt domain-containing protein [Leptolyngbyaceae cyanobacterium MAG.088]